MDAKRSPKNNRHNNQAPGQYYGYSLQATRALARLLDAAPGDVISLEVFEDVGIQTADGIQIAEQIKSARGRNPVSDHATDLWKTFGNWIDSINRGDIDPQKTYFEIYISSKKTVKS